VKAIHLSHRNQTKKLEIDSIHKNHTWKLVDLPFEKLPINIKWVFKTKWQVNGALDKSKARLVAYNFE